MQPGAPGPDPQQPPQNPYEQPAHGGAGAMGQPQGQNNTLGLIAMILGIIAIPLGLCCGLFGSPFGIAAIVLGFLGKKKADEGQASNRGQAMAGIICGAVGIVLGIISVALNQLINWENVF